MSNGKPLATLLRDEFLFFYSTRAKQHKAPTNMLTTIDQTGLQLVLVLSALSESASYDLNFLRTILFSEKSVGYALGHWTQTGTTDDTGAQQVLETVNIYTADSRSNYCWTEVGPPDGRTWAPGLQTLSSRVTRKPEIFFQELLNVPAGWAPPAPSLQLWEATRSKAVRRARQDLATSMIVLRPNL